MPKPAATVRLTLICVALLTFAGAIAAAAAGYAAPHGYQPAKCPFALPKGEVDGQTVSCGYMKVPEDRSVAGSRTLRLAVAVFHKTSPRGEAPPMVYLSGGPGGATLGEATSQDFSLIRKDRDIIFLDQRGTGYSEPKFDCPETKQAEADLAGLKLTPLETFERKQPAYRACHDRLAATGIQFAAYTSVENARDVADVVAALGYLRWEIYGVSYGTRLALTILRDEPHGVASVVLDSTFPPQAPLVPANYTGFQAALNRMFAACTAAPACQRAFPTAEDEFYSLLRNLKANPADVRARDLVTGETKAVKLTDERLLRALFTAFYEREFLPLVPTALNGPERASWTGIVTRLLLSFAVTDVFNIAQGLSLSVACAEIDPFQTADLQRAGQAAVRPELRGSVDPADAVRITHDFCEDWGVAPATQAEIAPVHSNVPTLILAGEFDPVTPPDFGRAAAATLPNSTFLEFRGYTRGVLSPGCPMEITAAFLAQPAKKVDASCVERLPPVKFALP